MNPSLSVLPLALCVACANEPTPPTDPAFLLTGGPGIACPSAAPPEEAFASFSAAKAEDSYSWVYLASSTFIEECSGAGGQHVLAVEPAGSRRAWLGGHTCAFADPSTTFPWAVALTNQTAGLFTAPEEWCVTLPGELRFQTSEHTAAMAFFGDEASAQEFVAALEWPR